MSAAPRATRNSPSFATAGRTVVALFGLELAVLLVVLSFFKISIDAAALWHGKQGAAAAAGSVAAAALSAHLARLYRADRRAFPIGVIANVFSLSLALGGLELLLRYVARDAVDGTTIAGVPIPRSWPTVVERNRKVFADLQRPYFDYDPELGWVVGKNRLSRDGMYASSAEGTRSATPGVSLADSLASKRVALIGDSNAFSLEVGFNDSLGHLLNDRLGKDVEVLNFGVDGYGIDQTYLRYERDVRPFHANVVVLMFVQHDIVRATSVYPCLSFGWLGYLVKPRFEIQDDKLVIINKPLPSLDQILDTVSPSDLPYVDYDPTYAATDWSWHYDRGPYLLRLLTAASPRWPTTRPEGTTLPLPLNKRLLEQLYVSIVRDGAKPIFVFAPSGFRDEPLLRQLIEMVSEPYLDMTECVSHVPADQRRTASGHHYAGPGNAAIAQCIEPTVQCALAGGANCIRGR